jgi:hypothetical protein
MVHHGVGSGRWVTVLKLDGSGAAENLFVIDRNGVTSGMQDCLMRYNWKDYYWVNAAGGVEYQLAGGGTIRLTKEGDGAARSVFCTSSAGTGVNAGGRAAGDATRGDCMSQIHVSDE